MQVGVPVAPISPAYSLMSKDFAKLKAIFELLRPELVWTADPERFAQALDAVGATPTPLAELLAEESGPEVREAFAGSDRTPREDPVHFGLDRGPKGVINTQRMLPSTRSSAAPGVAFHEGRPQVLVDWSLELHFRGQQQFRHDAAQRRHALHRLGQTGSRPDRDHRGDLREISPTMYYNVRLCSTC